MDGSKLDNIGDLIEAVEKGVIIDPVKPSTMCIACGERIELDTGQDNIVPRMCNECQDAVMFVRQMMSQQGVMVKDKHGWYQLLKYERA